LPANRLHPSLRALRERRDSAPVGRCVLRSGGSTVKKGVVCAEEDVARKRAERQRARDRGSASSDEEQPVFSLEDDDAPVLPATHST